MLGIHEDAKAFGDIWWTGGPGEQRPTVIWLPPRRVETLPKARSRIGAG
jgi:hypothetical protein